jgi:hypothetical protein
LSATIIRRAHNISGLQAWDANSSFDFEFDSRGPIASDQAAVIKAAPTRTMLSGTHGAKKPLQFLDALGDRARQANRRRAASGCVKISRENTTPTGLLGVGASWAMSFTRDAIVQGRFGSNHLPISTAMDSIIACLAGRRIDEVNANERRFPLENAKAVGKSLEKLLAREAPARLICSAACGADILALEACETLTIPATIVLPFAPSIFRATSVTDRPGNWGPRFDRVIGRARDRQELVELNLPSEDLDAFEKANIEIVGRTARLDARERLAILVWDGAKRGADDATADVRDRALLEGFRVLQVSTIESAEWSGCSD